MTTAYRAHDPRWSFAPASGAGAAIRGARFNPKGVPALYLALDAIGAIREANQGFSDKLQPCVLCSYEVDCDDIVDLSNETERRMMRIEFDELAAPWYDFLSAGVEPPQWRIVSSLIVSGAAGAITPSFARGATAADRNLVLWRWGPDPPHKVEVFDPSGRLPKNQLSWD